MASVSLDPQVAVFPDANGWHTSIHELKNASETKIAFKVKSTNNHVYRVRPVYGIVPRKSGHAAIEFIRRLPTRVADENASESADFGAGVEDKFVIEWMEVDDQDTDPQGLFRAFKEAGDNTTKQNGTITLQVEVK
uniref:Major sperm protein n=1 Tax=Ditylenchus dipsaci TaxID=166011 RepID=A0A915E5B0_9BILA